MKGFKALRRFAAVALVALPLVMTGCSGDDGAQGPPGTSQGTVAGTVTNSATGSGLADATVTVAPAVQGVAITTAADGTYSADLPIGNYTLTFDKANFASETATVSVVAAQTATRDATLMPTADVVVDAGADQTAAPGDTVNVSAVAEPLDGSTVQSITWSQSNSVTVDITDNGDGTASVTLPDLAAYKAELFNVLLEPPITAADLPPNVTPPAMIPEGLQDRFQVQGLNHFELEEAGMVTLTATVETNTGTFTDEVAVHAELPWHASPGIANVPLGVPVLVHGGTMGGVNSTWDWSITTAPASSTATLDDTAGQNPSFTPDAVGHYVLTDAVSGMTVDVYAGTFEGVIDSASTAANDGEIVPRTACTGCHAPGGIAPDAFTPWVQSGHSEIFTQNFNAGSSGHYGEGCFECHTVGFNLNATNAGFDDDTNYQAFLDQFFPEGHPAGGSGNWLTMLNDFPTVAQKANIQCENCHGPQNGSGAHTQGTPRVSLASEVCGACHGEPPRHGRNIQWQASPHANYELAIEEGTSGSCAPCHSAQGFVQWEDFGYDPNASITVTWTTDTVHPQTCATCHPPHNPGNISGAENNARVRVQDDTPMLKAGFQVLNAGRGAICMVCHNTRRGLVNDNNPDAAIVDGRAPHGGASADVLMGQNAFFVQTGVRGAHSLITDTCANCHMVQTPPPAVLSYNLGGTNHTFYASKDVCANCHSEVTAETVQAANIAQRTFLQTSLQGALEAQLNAQLAAGNDVTFVGTDVDGVEQTVTVTAASGNTFVVSNYADSHGRQAADLTVDDGVAPVTYTHAQIQNIDVSDGVNSAQLLSYGSVVQTIVKAGWNFLMATNERSDGVHNPTFSGQIIAGAQNVLENMDATVVEAVPAPAI